jgi:hypothetical protein
MDLMEIRQEAIFWNHLLQDVDNCCALVNTVMDLRISQNAGNLLIT